MRIAFAVLLSVVLAGLVTATEPVAPMPGSVAYLDSQYGFRDLKFEQSIKECKDMTLLEDAGETKFYTRRNDSLEFGGAKLKGIEYGFYKGKLANVKITAAGEGDAAAMLKALERDFGVGRQSPRNASKLYWFGKKVTMDYMPSATGPTSAAMWSKPLQALQQADKTAARR